MTTTCKVNAAGVIERHARGAGHVEDSRDGRLSTLSAHTAAQGIAPQQCQAVLSSSSAGGQGPRPHHTVRAAAAPVPSAAVHGQAGRGRGRGCQQQPERRSPSSTRQQPPVGPRRPGQQPSPGPAVPGQQPPARPPRQQPPADTPRPGQPQPQRPRPPAGPRGPGPGAGGPSRPQGPPPAAPWAPSSPQDLGGVLSPNEGAGKEMKMVARPGFGQAGRPLQLLVNHFRAVLRQQSATMYRLDVTLSPARSPSTQTTAVERGPNAERGSGAGRGRGRGRRQGGLSDAPPPVSQAGTSAGDASSSPTDGGASSSAQPGGGAAGTEAEPPGDRPSARMRELLLQAAQQLAVELAWPAGWAHDGAHVIVAQGPLPGLPRSKEVLQRNLVLPSANGRAVTVKVQLTGDVDLQTLYHFCRREQLQLPQQALQVLNIILQHVGRTQPQATVFSSRVLSSTNPIKLPGFCIELWEGYRQVLKATQAGLAVNLSPAVGIMRDAIDVLDLLATVGRTRRENLATWLQSPSNRALTDEALKGIKVTCKYRKADGVTSVRQYSLARLDTESATTFTFNAALPGQPADTISVADYCQRLRGTGLAYPALPLAMIRNSTTVRLPLEFLTVQPGQIIRKVAPDLLSMVGRYTVQDGTQRLRAIQQLPSAAGTQTDGTLRAWMAVEQGMTKVPARRLPRPESLMYGNRKLASINQDSGSWNLRDTPLLEGAALHSWAVISMIPERVKDFVIELAGALQASGLRITGASQMMPPLIPCSGANQLQQDFARAQQEGHERFQEEVRLVVVIIPRKDPVMYQRIKGLGELTVGVITQVIVAPNAGLGGPRRGRPNAMYLANVAMKISAKLGGKNCKLPPEQLPVIGKKRFMLLGADLSHGDPGSLSSTAAIVASMDQQAAQWVTRVIRQQHPAGRRQDLIQGQALTTCVLELLERYHVANRQLPQALLMFRDGVAEGQQEEVAAVEVAAIKEACAAAAQRFNQPSATMLLTFVCVQKRHATHFFPASPAEGGKNGNIKPGTVVDQCVCHPWGFDFFLAAHAAIKGTTRPTHFNVLVDENSFGADDLQLLTYRLSHLYSRCTRSISLPPPAALAHLVADRGRILAAQLAAAGRGTGQQGTQQAAQRPAGRGGNAVTAALQSLALQGGAGILAQILPVHDAVKNCMFFT